MPYFHSSFCPRTFVLTADADRSLLRGRHREQADQCGRKRRIACRAFNSPEGVSNCIRVFSFEQNDFLF